MRHEWHSEEPLGTAGNTYWEFKGSSGSIQFALLLVRFSANACQIVGGCCTAFKGSQPSRQSQEVPSPPGDIVVTVLRRSQPVRVLSNPGEPSIFTSESHGNPGARWPPIPVIVSDAISELKIASSVQSTTASNKRLSWSFGSIETRSSASPAFPAPALAVEDVSAEIM
jgi:hypothetical protein